MEIWTNDVDVTAILREPSTVTHYTTTNGTLSVTNRRVPEDPVFLFVFLELYRLGKVCCKEGEVSYGTLLMIPL